MKSLGNHLYNRNGYYYFRLNLPKKISELILMTEIVIALGTKDTLKARLYCAQLDYQINDTLSDVLGGGGEIDFTSLLEDIKSSTGIQSVRKPNYISN